MQTDRPRKAGPILFTRVAGKSRITPDSHPIE